MKKVILVSKDGREDELKDLIENSGHQFEQMSAIPNIFIIEDCQCSDFPLKNHDSVLSYEDDEIKFKGADSLELNQGTWGPWPKLRHLRRDLPWDRGVKFPWVSEEFTWHRRGRNVDIYIVDSGTYPDHDEFGGRVTTIGTHNFLNNHGTFCASCAAGATLGLATEAEIFSAVGLPNANNTGSSTQIITAINNCKARYDSRASLGRSGVLNLSLSGSSNAYETTLNACMNAGMVVCASAANNRILLDTNNVYPAINDGVITVGGINMMDEPYNTGTSGTNYGRKIDILAGSQHCCGALMNTTDEYRTASGTSYGNAYVVGVVACILEDYVRLTTRDHVMAVTEFIYRQATFGRYRPDARFTPMTPAILYLDPAESGYAQVPGLTLRA